MSLRIALLSDLHASLSALKAVLGDIDRRATVDPFHAVYCLGDLGGYAAEPNEVQALLMERGWPTILGNYDEGVGFERDDCGCKYTDPFDIAMSDRSFRWTRAQTSAGNKAWLRGLPRELRLDVKGYSVLLCHGSPRDITEYLFDNRSAGYLRQFTPGGRADAGAEIICFGHPHVPYHRVVDGTHFINTGSVGRPKDGDPRAGYCILALDDAGVRVEQVRIPYDVESTCGRIAEVGLPAYFAAYLRTGGCVPEDAPERMLALEGQLPT